MVSWWKEWKVREEEGCHPWCMLPVYSRFLILRGKKILCHVEKQQQKIKTDDQQNVSMHWETDERPGVLADCYCTVHIILMDHSSCIHLCWYSRTSVIGNLGDQENWQIGKKSKGVELLLYICVSWWGWNPESRKTLTGLHLSSSLSLNCLLSTHFSLEYSCHVTQTILHTL